MRYTTFRKNELGQVCRSCINKKFHFHLRRKNCIYASRQDVCNCCGQQKNIVVALRLGSRHKVWFK